MATVSTMNIKDIEPPAPYERLYVTGEKHTPDFEAFTEQTILPGAKIPAYKVPAKIKRSIKKAKNATNDLSTDTEYYQGTFKKPKDNIKKDSEYFEKLIDKHLTQIEKKILDYQIIGSRDPCPKPTIIKRLMNDREKVLEPSLNAQYSNDDISPNFYINDISYNTAPRDVTSIGKERMNDFERKLKAPVNYSNLNQIKEQVLINVNDVNKAQIGDLDADDRNQINGEENDKIDLNYAEQGLQRKSRIQFYVPTSGRVRGYRRRTLATNQTSQNNIDIVRRAEALNKATDQLFNTKFIPQEEEIRRRENKRTER